ncbi:HAD family hydrolase [archaeon]|nr:MAG: HAD family hydrolase [archaeon]
MNAIVFDKSGTVVDTLRVACDVATHEMMVNVSSTALVDRMVHGALLILENSEGERLLASDDEMNFLEFCKRHALWLRCVYTNNPAPFSLSDALSHCDTITLKCFRRTLKTIEDEIGGVYTNNGVIYDVAHKAPRYVLSTGGRLFPGVTDLFSYLSKSGWDIFFATGDSYEGMREFTHRLGVPSENVFCFQTEEKKAHAVRTLKQHYDRVVMVGNDSNDRAAFREADASVLVLQDGHEKHPEIYLEATHIIENVIDLKDILDVGEWKSVR